MNPKSIWNISVLILSLNVVLLQNVYSQDKDENLLKVSSSELYTIPTTGNKTIVTCSGILFDNGETKCYSNNSEGSVTIFPGAKNKAVQLDFTSFSFENSYDFVEIYDGKNLQSPLIGIFDTNPGKIVASNNSGALTIRLRTDDNNAKEGFYAFISCVKRSSNKPKLIKPDLFIEKFELSSDTLFSGQTSSINLKVINKGKGHASPSILGIYLSSNTKMDQFDTLLGSVEIGKLYGSESSELTKTIIIPEKLKKGEYFLIARSDIGGSLNESNESNNILSLPIIINELFTNIKTINYGLKDSIVEKGKSVKSYVTISNNGNLTANFSTGIYISKDCVFDKNDLLIDEKSLELFPGEKKGLKFETIIPNSLNDGRYYLIANADSKNEYSEIDENDNFQIAETRLRVIEGKPDLAITAKSSVSSFVSGDTVEIYYTIFNYGNITSPATSSNFFISSDATLDSDDIPIFSSSIPTLLSGENFKGTYKLNFPAGFPPGIYYLIGNCDPLDTIEEYDEMNNQAFIQVELKELVSDLRVGFLEFSNYSVFPDNEVSMFFTVHNDGPEFITSITNGIYLSKDEKLGDDDICIAIDSIESIDSYSLSYRLVTVVVPAEIETGEYTVLVKIDKDNLVREISEENNITSNLLNVIPVNSLITIPFQGHANVKVCNEQLYEHAGFSNYKANSDGVITLYPEDTTKCISINFSALDLGSGDFLEIYDGEDINTISLGRFTTLPAPVVARNNSGALTLRFFSDTLESSSGLEASIECIEKSPFADLSIQSLERFDQRGYIEVLGTLYNAGSYTVPYTNVAFYLSTDSIIGDTDLPLGTVEIRGFSGNNEFSFLKQIIWPSILRGGDYFVIAKVDDINFINETNELNNTHSFPITLPDFYYDLTLGVVDVYFQNIPAGGITETYLEVFNTGTNPIPDAGIGIYLSTDQVFDPSDILVTSNNTDFLDVNSGNYYLQDVRIPDNVALGAYYLVFVADNTNQFTESDELNNIAYLPIEVVPVSYDLELSDIQIDRNPTAPGHSVLIAYTILNNGTTEVNSGPVGFYLSSDNQLDETDLSIGVDSVYVPRYGAQPITSLTIPTFVDYGDYYLIAKVDINNSLLEFNEDNNAFGIPITLTAPVVDLRIDFTQTENNNLVPGIPFNLFASVSNNGSIISNVSQLNTYLSNDQNISDEDILLRSTVVEDLEPGFEYTANATLEIPNATELGEYYLISRITPNELDIDIDNSNNTFLQSISVSQQFADLEFQTPPFYFSGYANGSVLSSYAIYGNIGNQISAATDAAIYLSHDDILDNSDLLLNSFPISALSSNGNELVQISFTLPDNLVEKTYYLIHKLDNSNVVQEENEENNIYTASIVIEPVRYDVSGELYNIYQPVFNSYWIAEYSVKNNGNSSVSIGTNFSLFVSQDQELSGSDYLVYSNTGGFIESYSEVTGGAEFEMPEGLSAGTHYLIMVVDPANDLNESNESNNFVVNSFYIDGGLESRIGLESDRGTAGFIIYPNPSKGYINVNLENFSNISSEAALIKIYNSAGFEVVNKSIFIHKEGELKSLDLSELAKGLYTVKLQVGTLVKTQKVVLE